MSENKKRPKFSRSEMLADHAPANTPSQAPAAPAEEDKNTITIELKGFSHMGVDNGFIIATGRLVEDSKKPDLPINLSGRFNPEKILIKGVSMTMCDMSSVGTVFELQGDWIVDPRWGLQMVFTSAREAMPTSTEALLKYLSAGRIKGIGPAIAKTIVDTYGSKTFEVLNGDFGDLSSISGISKTKSEDIKKSWASKKALYQMTAFFGMYGIGEAYIPRIAEEFGLEGLEARVRANPYILTNVDGIGFITADKMALSLGTDPRSPKRLSAMLSHLLREYSDKNGHTAQPVNDWINDAARILFLPPESLHETASKLVNDGEVFVRNIAINSSVTGKPSIVQCVSSRRDYKNEESIAFDLARIKSKVKPLKETDIFAIQNGVSLLVSKLDPSQIDGVRGVLSSSISVLTGGPGTGKTTTLKNVIDIAHDMKLNVVLAAPTGRAAKRMEEAIGQPASTIHRALRYNPSQGYMHNSKNPMVGDLFVVDESSMIDNALASQFLKAIPDGAKVIFVGDIDQLPPVGPGDFLKDLINSSTASVFKLTRIHRQAEGSHIAEAAQKILSGQLPKIGGMPATDDFSWILPPADCPQELINTFIKDAVCKLAQSYVNSGYKKSDIQIISPQKDGVAGVAGLNESLRWILNEKFSSPQPENENDDFPFFKGDRVMISKNNADKEIFNGDMGIIEDIDDTIGIRMEDGRLIDLERAECKGLQLGYAITVHKSQGGERPVIIMPISPSHSITMTKNLLYTGVTRGRNRVVMVGPSKTVMVAIKKQNKTSRVTGLVQEIRKVKPANLDNSQPKTKNTI